MLPILEALTREGCVLINTVCCNYSLYCIRLTQPVTWASFALMLVAGGALWVYVRMAKQKKEERTPHTHSHTHGRMHTHSHTHGRMHTLTLTVAEKEKTRSLGKAALGGPFSLVDHNGDRRTEQDFNGQWMLLYFGFTFCPDICPDELQKMGEVITKLGWWKVHLCVESMCVFESLSSSCR